MKRICLTITLVLAISGAITAQNFPTNPDSCKIVTKDIDNFWQSFELFQQGFKGNPFNEHYIKMGSQGVIDFTPYRIQHADTIFKNVKESTSKYLAVKEGTFNITKKRKQITATFYALKYWFPEAVFPPVYFVIGNFNSGGTSSPNGLIIGAETQNNIDNIPYIVAHELIHFQQRTYSQNPTLLEQAINEGTADFIGEMISGNHINKNAFEYGYQHQDDLCKEFVRLMDSDELKDWLYGTSGKDSRPNDLGYWMGYQIAKSFFNNHIDKHQAIRELLDIKDAKTVLKKSGFLDEYMK